MIAAVYVRKSTDDERTSEDGRSVERQHEVVRADATRNGDPVTLAFQDDGVSGVEFANRPGFAAMLDAARKRKFQRLYIMALNRLGRDRERVGMALKELHEAGVKVWTYQTHRDVPLATSTERLALGASAAPSGIRFALR